MIHSFKFLAFFLAVRCDPRARRRMSIRCNKNMRNGKIQSETRAERNYEIEMSRKILKNWFRIAFSSSFSIDAPLACRLTVLFGWTTFLISILFIKAHVSSSSQRRPYVVSHKKRSINIIVLSVECILDIMGRERLLSATDILRHRTRYWRTVVNFYVEAFWRRLLQAEAGNFVAIAYGATIIVMEKNLFIQNRSMS